MPILVNTLYHSYFIASNMDIKQLFYLLPKGQSQTQQYHYNMVLSGKIMSYLRQIFALIKEHKNENENGIY